MGTRIGYSTVFMVLIAVLVICSLIAYRSKKSIGKAVCWLDLSFIPPIVGNLIILGVHDRTAATFGYFMYFLGMDLVMIAVINHTTVYCSGVKSGHKVPKTLYFLLAGDAVQLLINPLTGHAFGLEEVLVDDEPYFRLLPHFGIYFHRAVVYMIIGMIFLIYIVIIKKMPRIYRERYTVIVCSMGIVAVWQTFYIFSRTPIDRSMIGYGVLGLLMFYFGLYYRPLRLLDRMLSNIAAELPEALFVFDPTGKCVWTNKPGEELAGISQTNLDDATVNLEKVFGEGKIYRGEANWTENFVIGTGEDAVYYILIMHSFSDDDQRHAGSFLAVRDTTEEQRRVKRELYNSTHDSLTGLFTKQHLYECIRKKLDTDRSTRYNVVFVDVKNFKIVNDIFSSAFGDLALKRIAGWIRKDTTPRCVYGRLEGDTFGVLVPVLEFDAERLESKLDNFIVSDGNVEHHVLIHLGVCEVTDRELDVSVMFDRAHLALSTINEEYKTHIAYYDDKLRDKVMWNQQISAGLKEAIAQMQLRPYFQPIADANGRVVGAEALARWLHPRYGFMPPSDFIPLFEKNGMIVEADRHIWRCACRKLADWKARGIDLFISVNISPKDFYFINVVSEIRGLAKEYGIDPEKLRIEITETVMMNDSDDRMRNLAELRSDGFIVEMDDFGSGYSSLSLLKDMPVDVLKIDMKFLSFSGDRDRARTIVRNIIRLSDELGIVSLTEGVETEHQFKTLAEIGCRLFQGYYFAKPMPEDEFEKFAGINSTDN